MDELLSSGMAKAKQVFKATLKYISFFSLSDVIFL